MLEDNVQKSVNYVENIPPEVKEVFFYELSKYSAVDLAKYFLDGVTSIRITGTENRVVLPKDSDNRRELIQEYLLNKSETFRADFREYLDDDLVGDSSAESVLL